jgi:hypothetical protein
VRRVFGNAERTETPSVRLLTIPFELTRSRASMARRELARNFPKGISGLEAKTRAREATFLRPLLGARFAGNSDSSESSALHTLPGATPPGQRRLRLAAERVRSNARGRRAAGCVGHLPATLRTTLATGASRQTRASRQSGPRSRAEGLEQLCARYELLAEPVQLGHGAGQSKLSHAR